MNSGTDFKNEVKLSVQAFIIWFVYLSNIYMWTYWNPVTKFENIIIYVYIVVECGFTPYMYLAFNR